MANMLTREFWAASAERAVKTAAQTAIALIGTDQVGILSLDWAQIGSVVATATVLSVLTSITGDTTRKNGPSFVRSEGIGIESAEAEAALLRERAREAEDDGVEAEDFESFHTITGAVASDEEDDEALPAEDEGEPEDFEEFVRLRDRLGDDSED